MSNQKTQEEYEYEYKTGYYDGFRLIPSKNNTHTYLKGFSDGKKAIFNKYPKLLEDDNKYKLGYKDSINLYPKKCLDIEYINGYQDAKKEIEPTLVAANELSIDGITTIPILQNIELRKQILNEFHEMCQSFPEYKRDPNISDLTPEHNKIIYVLGGFGAFGNPASFHHPLSRKLREWAMSSLIPIIKNYININFKEENYNLEALFDRFSLRRKGTSPSKDAWHRDVTPNLKKGDIVFGGWLNLNLNTSHFFSCIPESQIGIDQCSIESGFASFPKNEHDFLNYQKKEIECPPGNLIIFPQHISHEVLAKKSKEDLYRLYMGWRLTKSENSLQNTEQIIENQGVPLLPSKQHPPMFANNHLSFFKNKKITIDPTNKNLKQNIKDWSIDTFKSNLLEEKIGKNGEKYIVVPRFMKSLKEYKLQLYPKYDEYEKKIFQPSNIWLLKEVGKNTRKEYKI